MSWWSVIVLGAVNETLSFLTLSLLLQLGFVAQYVNPSISRLFSTLFFFFRFRLTTELGDLPAAYVVLGVQFVLTFYAVPALVSVFSTGCAKPAKDSSIGSQVCEKVLFD